MPRKAGKTMRFMAVGYVAFREVSHLVGLTRLNQSGGAIMEDFDNNYQKRTWKPFPLPK